MDFLSGVETLVGVICNDYVQVSVFALVVVTAGAPVLPFAGLLARAFLPHLVGVIETTGIFAVSFEGEIFLGFWIIILELTLRPSHNHIFAPPRKLLNIRAMIRQRDRSPIIGLVSRSNVT